MKFSEENRLIVNNAMGCKKMTAVSANPNSLSSQVDEMAMENRVKPWVRCRKIGLTSR